MNHAMISASLQCAPPLDVASSVRTLENSGIDMFHFDIMDGHFVPNFALSIDQLEALSKMTKLPIDAHLMMTHPSSYIEPVVKAGASLVCFHIEVAEDIADNLRQIHELGALAGLAISPETDLERLTPYLHQLNYILVMAIKPGFAGQAFIPATLERISTLAKHQLPIMVDGGLDDATCLQCIKCGASILVAGKKSIFTPAHPLEEATKDHVAFIRQCALKGGIPL